MSEKKINLCAMDRFVSSKILRDAYIQYEDSFAPEAPRYVSLGRHPELGIEEPLELGIISTSNPVLARAISSVLSRSLQDARNDAGGHLPDRVVERVQTEIISPWGVSNLWGSDGHRFVLSRQVSFPPRHCEHEILASILVGRSKDGIFFFTGRYNNLRYATMARDVDLTQPYDLENPNPEQRWFDCFRFPRLAQFKPNRYHHIANFVVAREHRGKKLSRFLLERIVEHYSRDYIKQHRGDYCLDPSLLTHSQHLLCGIGFWQIGDPPWLPKMKRLGFYLRAGAESFFYEHPWAPLPPIYAVDVNGARGDVISNTQYNHNFGLPKRYRDAAIWRNREHLLERIPEVIQLSQDPQAKLQYFQAMYDFLPE